MISILTVVQSNVLQVVACQQVNIRMVPVANPTKQESKRKERKETKAQESSKLRYSLLCFCSIRFVEGEFGVVSYYGDGCTVLRVLYCTSTVLVVGAHCSLYSTSFTGTVLAPDTVMKSKPVLVYINYI